MKRVFGFLLNMLFPCALCSAQNTSSILDSVKMLKFHNGYGSSFYAEQSYVGRRVYLPLRSGGHAIYGPRLNKIRAIAPYTDKHYRILEITDGGKLENEVWHGAKSYLHYRLQSIDWGAIVGDHDHEIVKLQQEESGEIIYYTKPNNLVSMMRAEYRHRHFSRKHYLATERSKAYRDPSNGAIVIVEPGSEWCCIYTVLSDEQNVKEGFILKNDDGKTIFIQDTETLNPIPALFQDKNTLSADLIQEIRAKKIEMIPYDSLSPIVFLDYHGNAYSEFSKAYDILNRAYIGQRVFLKKSKNSPYTNDIYFSYYSSDHYSIIDYVCELVQPQQFYAIRKNKKYSKYFNSDSAGAVGLARDNSQDTIYIDARHIGQYFMSVGYFEKAKQYFEGKKFVDENQAFVVCKSIDLDGDGVLTGHFQQLSDGLIYHLSIEPDKRTYEVGEQYIRIGDTDPYGNLSGIYTSQTKDEECPTRYFSERCYTIGSELIDEKAYLDLIDRQQRIQQEKRQKEEAEQRLIQQREQQERLREQQELEELEKKINLMQQERQQKEEAEQRQRQRQRQQRIQQEILRRQQEKEELKKKIKLRQLQ